MVWRARGELIGRRRSIQLLQTPRTNTRDEQGRRAAVGGRVRGVHRGGGRRRRWWRQCHHGTRVLRLQGPLRQQVCPSVCGHCVYMLDSGGKGGVSVALLNKRRPCPLFSHSFIHTARPSAPTAPRRTSPTAPPARSGHLTTTPTAAASRATRSASLPKFRSRGYVRV